VRASPDQFDSVARRRQSSRPVSNHPRSGFAGVIYGLLAYLAWGLLPIYWKQVETASPDEILSHRIIWSLLFVALVLSLQRGWKDLWKICRSSRAMAWAALSGTLIATNWFLYIWAVLSSHIVETSFGYYLTPLANVLVGALILRERLRPVQIIAILLAAIGLIPFALGLDHFPWLALALCFSFAFYGLIRKIAPAGALNGLFLETAWLTPLAACLIGWRICSRTGTFLFAGHQQTILLVAAGAVTAMPLIWFAAAARRVSMSTLGILQYIAPSVAFLVSVFVYPEPVTAMNLLGFAFIWVALALYTSESLLHYRPRRITPAAPVAVERCPQSSG
jgi:chloramphenicol-sensitive protein RarD